MGLTDIMAGHYDSLALALGESVTYHRGNASVVLTAVPAGNSQEVDVGDGITEEVDVQDWLLKAADLILSGSVTEPADGDVIERANGRRYMVAPPPTRRSWKYSDPGETIMRLRTKKVARAV